MKMWKLSHTDVCDCGERQTMSHLMTCIDAPNCTWAYLAIPTLAGVNCAKHWEESISLTFTTVRLFVYYSNSNICITFAMTWYRGFNTKMCILQNNNNCDRSFLCANTWHWGKSVMATCSSSIRADTRNLSFGACSVVFSGWCMERIEWVNNNHCWPVMVWVLLRSISLRQQRYRKFRTASDINIVSCANKRLIVGASLTWLIDYQYFISPIAAVQLLFVSWLPDYIYTCTWKRI